jgi:flagellar biosynthesis/type III secretory pathway ATPase
MGARALEFSRAHPVDSPGYATTLKQLEEQLARSEQLAKEQERGTTEVRAATARKSELKRSIRRSQLVHLGRVAERAAKDVPELAQKFDLPRIPTRNLPFRTVARTMVEEAQQQKELLVKHGLVAEILDSLGQSLDQFDQAVDRAAEGRRVHIGAAANLEAVSDEIVQIVKVLDGFNRFRFSAEPDLLAGWTAASNVIGPPHPADKPVAPAAPTTGDQIKPAA